MKRSSLVAPDSVDEDVRSVKCESVTVVKVDFIEVEDSTVFFVVVVAVIKSVEDGLVNIVVEGSPIVVVVDNILVDADVEAVLNVVVIFDGKIILS